MGTPTSFILPRKTENPFASFHFFSLHPVTIYKNKFSYRLYWIRIKSGTTYEIWSQWQIGKIGAILSLMSGLSPMYFYATKLQSFNII
jgi:hypothetical protein